VLRELKCAAARVFAFLSMTLDTRRPHPHLHSLGSNQLCGVGIAGRGTYTSEGITKLCEGLKGSSVTSLRCAIDPGACLSVNAH
jgi:hypothetical protein